MDSQIERVMRPSSIAIIGASRDPAKRGARAIRMLLDHGYAGKIAPINPREDEIMGLPCFASVADVPYPVDLALVCTPARMAPEMVRQCAERAIAGAVILAGGFSEAGPEGAVLEAELVQAARTGGVRLVGPNTAGMFDAYDGSFLMSINGVRPGAIGVISQSGNVLVSLVAQSLHHGASGFTSFVGLGNEADIQYHEYVDYFAADPRTKVLTIYIEGLKNGAAFIESARRMTAHKPIVLYKAGRTQEGQSAAKSHSGSLAGDYPVAIGAFRQAGISVVERSDEMFAVSDMLALHAGRPARRVAVLSEGGGPISQAVDALSELGLALPRLAASTEAGLKAITPNASQLSNPVDAGGGTDPHPKYYAPCAEQILADPDIDTLLIVGYFGAFQLRHPHLAEIEDQAARELVALKDASGKVVVVQCHYGDLSSAAIAILREGGIPVIRSIETACAALGALADYRDHKARPYASVQAAVRAPASAGAVLGHARARGRDALLEPEALEFLRLHGIAVPETRLIATPDEAAGLPPSLLERPVALKIVSPDILHKTEIGGVTLGVTGALDIAAAHRTLLDRVRAASPEARIAGVLVAPMAGAGTELIVGMVRDPRFGPMITFGLGGTSVEIYRDVAFAPLPLDAGGAEQLIDSLRGKALLDGARGSAPVSRAMLVDLLVRFGTLVAAHPEIAEIDLNPVRAMADRYAVLDARVILSPAGEEKAA